MKNHHYKLTIEWTGNKGSGTFDYRSYSRNHTIKIPSKSAEILGSSDSSFRGDATRYNPEELFLSSVSSCHMLWYLHLCSDNKVIVHQYEDHAEGIMEEAPDGSGRFKQIILHPQIVVTEASMIEKAIELHHKANKLCFIANSLNLEVEHRVKVVAL